MKRLLVVLAAVLGLWAVLVRPVSAHGRMVEPPARNTMWRYGFENPRNYDDDELFCGGITKQWDSNNGKCGVCGDDFSEATPRKHEVGGFYGNGIIVKTYSPGQVITVTIHLSTNHMGYYEFRLCPYLNPKNEVTEKCLDDSLLPFADTYDTRWHIPDDTPGHNYTIDLKLKLPERFTCKNCVLQWHYYTGNFWGNCENGTSARGCGNQETYRNCADIAIGYYNQGHAHAQPYYFYNPFFQYFHDPKKSSFGDVDVFY